VRRPPDPQQPAIGSPADSRPDSGGSAPAILSLQRSAGNAAVASRLGHTPVVQRASVEIDEVVSTVRTVEGGAALSPELVARIIQIVMAQIEQESGQSRAGSSGPTRGDAAAGGGSPSPYEDSDD
jgi:hypothetical protein